MITFAGLYAMLAHWLCMDSGASGGSAIERSLSKLEQRYDPFPVNQTTVSLSREQFEQVADRCETAHVDAYAKVANDERDILHVEGEEGTELPGESVELTDRVEAQIHETVREMTGIDCEIEGVESVTIAGLRDETESDPETRYRLVVVFEARYQSGTVTADACWKPAPRTPTALSA